MERPGSERRAESIALQMMLAQKWDVKLAGWPAGDGSTGSIPKEPHSLSLSESAGSKKIAGMGK